VLFIEASAVEGSAGLTLTGQLGDVMKESAQIAWAYVRAHADLLGITDRADLRPAHPHPRARRGRAKDGPSAGVTMVTALTSMALGRAVRSKSG
jgi:ATP-dependent Lon protease